MYPVPRANSPVPCLLSFQGPLFFKTHKPLFLLIDSCAPHLKTCAEFFTHACINGCVLGEMCAGRSLTIILNWKLATLGQRREKGFEMQDGYPAQMINLEACTTCPHMTLFPFPSLISIGLASSFFSPRFLSLFLARYSLISGSD